MQPHQSRPDLTVALFRDGMLAARSALHFPECHERAHMDALFLGIDSQSPDYAFFQAGYICEKRAENPKEKTWRRMRRTLFGGRNDRR